MSVTGGGTGAGNIPPAGFWGGPGAAGAARSVPILIPERFRLGGTALDPPVLPFCSSRVVKKKKKNSPSL